MREYPKMKVSDLVPYEKTITGPRLNKAIKNLKPKGFTEPVEVFPLDGEWFVRDGTHRCTAAATELEIAEVPITEVDPPDDWKKVRDEMAEHLELKGFQKMPRSGLADRAEREQHITLDDLQKFMPKKDD